MRNGLTKFNMKIVAAVLSGTSYDLRLQLNLPYLHFKFRGLNDRNPRSSRKERPEREQCNDKARSAGG